MTDQIRNELTDKEARLIRERLESDLNKKPKKCRKTTLAVDAILKLWAQQYKSGDYREIRRTTGSKSGSQLGRAMKQAGKSSSSNYFVSELSDDDYASIQLIISQMVVFNRAFLFSHYVKRPKILATIYEKTPQYTAEKDTTYRKRVSDLYYKKVGITKPTYNRYLRDARYEFSVRGGIR